MDNHDDKSKVKGKNLTTLIVTLGAHDLVSQIDKAIGMAVFQLDWVPSHVLHDPTVWEADVKERVEQVKKQMKYSIFMACTGGRYSGLQFDIAKPYEQDKTERQIFMDHQLAEKLGATLLNAGIPSEAQVGLVMEKIKESGLGEKLHELNKKAKVLDEAVDKVFDEIIKMMGEGSHRKLYSEYKTRANLVFAGIAVFILAATFGMALGAVAVAIATGATIGRQAMGAPMPFEQILDNLFTHKTPEVVLTITALLVTCLVVMLQHSNISNSYNTLHSTVAVTMLNILGNEKVENALEQSTEQKVIKALNEATANTLNKIGNMKKVADELEKNIEGYAETKSKGKGKSQ